MRPIKELIPLLDSPKNIVITTHPKPDGDAMGSSLGLYHYLLGKGHNVHVIIPTECPTFLHWMPGINDVTIFTEQEEYSKQLIDKAELFFGLDFNGLRRIGDLGNIIATSSASKVLIDHHLDPDGFDHFRLWNAKACATCELVFDLLSTIFNDSSLITKDIASCLYTGLVTDSGSFRFPSVTPKVHLMVAKLLETGIDHAHINELIFSSNTENRMRMLGHCLQDGLTVLPEYHTAIIIIRKEDWQKYGANPMSGDTEGIVNYALSINNIKLAVIIIERLDQIKLSFRSKGDFPANKLAKEYFEGGGHHNAAGGQSNTTVDETFTRLLESLNIYKSLLII